MMAIMRAFSINRPFRILSEETDTFVWIAKSVALQIVTAG